MRRIFMFFVTLFRKIRSWFATAYLRYRAVKCGKHVGAARMPHIASPIRLEIGSHAGFNGITISGWGG